VEAFRTFPLPVCPGTYQPHRLIVWQDLLFASSSRKWPRPSGHRHSSEIYLTVSYFSSSQLSSSTYISDSDIFSPPRSSRSHLIPYRPMGNDYKANFKLLLIKLHTAIGLDSSTSQSSCKADLCFEFSSGCPYKALFHRMYWRRVTERRESGTCI
jgi:hypothetical protein